MAIKSMMPKLFISIAPRPYTIPSRSSPPKGFSCQNSSSTGTTSIWFKSSNGFNSGFIPVSSAKTCIRLGSSGTVNVSNEIPSFSKILANHCAARRTSPGGLLVSIRKYCCKRSTVSMLVFSQLGSANRMEIERNKSRCFFILKVHDDIQDLDYIKECNITIFIHISGKIHAGLGFSRIQNNIHRN